MDAPIADLDAAPDGLAERQPNTPEREAGASPSLALAGFAGPLEQLLTLARTQQIDLSALSFAAIVDQLAAALQQAPAAVSLGQKGDWVVMAAWLVQLRARLLLPLDAPAQQQAIAEAAQLREHLVARQEMQALVGWLERRPQLGHHVFARGQSEVFGVSVETTQPVDIVAFLWASLALFDDGEAAPDTTSVYQPRHFELYTVADARDRILRRLGTTPGGALLDQLLPEAPEQAETPAHHALRQRSAWSSTLIASLELAKQGDVALAQEAGFAPIRVSPAVSNEAG